MHAQREGALRPRHLIVIQLHGINGAAAEFIVLRIRAEYGGQKHTGGRAFRMGIDHSYTGPAGDVDLPLTPYKTFTCGDNQSNDSYR